MKHVALVIGHGPSIDKGAKNSDRTTELEWNRDLVKRISMGLIGKLTSSIVHRQIERRQPVEETNATNADFAVEFHCNSNGPTSSGTEMIHFPGSTLGKKLASIMLEEVVQILLLPNRGVKPPEGGRGRAFLARTRMPAVIAESMFINNSNDLRVANSNKDRLAEAYARAFIRFADMI